MKRVIFYKTPKEFLDSTERFLEQKEIENNLILGICNAIPDKNIAHEERFFINAFNGITIKATSINTTSKALISGTGKDTSYINSLARFYLENKIELSGVMGEKFYAEAFSQFYGKKEVGERVMLVHKLKTVKNLSLAMGELKVATSDDIHPIASLTFQFHEESNNFPKKSSAQILKDTEQLVYWGNLFKWVHPQSEIVSMAAIVRETRNIGIVGLVYTPPNLRGKGYATSCVQKLSEYILEKGFSGCGLFTDISNPTSNSIYRKIGYNPLTEFKDIQFG